MTDQPVEVPEQELSPDNKYLQELLNKYGANQSDESLTAVQRTLLAQVQTLTKDVGSITSQAEELSKEITERQNTIMQLNQQVLHKRGQSQGLIDALLALREE